MDSCLWTTFDWLYTCPVTIISHWFSVAMTCRVCILIHLSPASLVQINTIQQHDQPSICEFMLSFIENVMLMLVCAVV